MFEMANNDTAPIVNEMETEHEVTLELPAQTTEAVKPLSILSLNISTDVLRACAHMLVYSLLGGSSLVTLWFAFKTPGEMTVFQWHIALSMMGYQLLMPHAFLCLQNLSWAAPLSFERRRRAHWILHLVGSVLAFTGSVIMMARETVNFHSLHGKFALAALLFTIASLANGVSSLYTTQLRRYISPRVSKVSHTLVGITAFVLSSVCLIYGYLKHSFTEWASVQFAYTMIAITCTYTFCVIISPIYKISRSLFDVVMSKIF